MSRRDSRGADSDIDDDDDEQFYDAKEDADDKREGKSKSPKLDRLASKDVAVSPEKKAPPTNGSHGGPNGIETPGKPQTSQVEGQPNGGAKPDQKQANGVPTTTTTPSTPASPPVMNGSGTHGSQQQQQQQSQPTQQQAPSTPASSGTSSTRNEGSPSSPDPEVFMVKNLDTGEVCRIDEVTTFFPQTKKVMTLDALETAQQAETKEVGQIVEHVKEDVKAEQSEAKKTLGFADKMKKLFSRGPPSLKGQDNQVKVRTNNLNKQELTDLKTVQNLLQHVGPIWCMAWSRDGNFLATGGQDSIVRVWCVANTPAAAELERKEKERKEHEGKDSKDKPLNKSGSGRDLGPSVQAQPQSQSQNANVTQAQTSAPNASSSNANNANPNNNATTTTHTNGSTDAKSDGKEGQPHSNSNSSSSSAAQKEGGDTLGPLPSVEQKQGDHGSSIPKDKGGREILKLIPYWQYSGHKADVIDLAWSQANFLLSASIDKTVRLWHVSRGKCLCLFQHSDFVTAVAFHPKEDRYFVSGSFDKKLRIWDIPEHRVVEWAQTSNIITAAAFQPSGNMAVAGLYNGMCVFYQTEGLKYYTQIDCRNRHGKNRNGKKVTGLQFSPDGKLLLVTTNDSRVRLYDMGDYHMSCKYKGPVNDELQIRAYFDADTRHIICGSENQQVYVWKTLGDALPGAPLPKKSKTNESYEYFKATATTVTCAQFVPRVAIETSAQDKEDAAKIQHMIVAAGYNGELKFFENRGKPKDL